MIFERLLCHFPHLALRRRVIHVQPVRKSFVESIRVLLCTEKQNIKMFVGPNESELSPSYRFSFPSSLAFSSSTTPHHSIDVIVRAIPIIQRILAFRQVSIRIPISEPPPEEDLVQFSICGPILCSAIRSHDLMRKPDELRVQECHSAQKILTVRCKCDTSPLKFTDCCVSCGLKGVT